MILIDAKRIAELNAQRAKAEELMRRPRRAPAEPSQPPNNAALINAMRTGREDDKKLQAELEWDFGAVDQSRFRNRENYVNFRIMELEGRVHTSTG